MQELLQSNGIAGSVEESLKAMLSQKMSMTTTTQGMDFSEIFANATKKQKELADFASSNAKNKPANTTVSTKKLKNENNISDNSKAQNTQSEDKKLNKQDNKAEGENKLEDTTSKNEENVENANNEELEKITAQLKEAENISKETSIIETIDISNIDTNEKTTTEETKETKSENATLKTENKSNTTQETKALDNLQKIEIDLAEVDETAESTTETTEDISTINTKTTGKTTQTKNTNEIDLAEVDELDVASEETKTLKGKIFVDQENIQNETNMTLDEIMSSNEPNIEGIVEEKILKDLNLNVDEIMLGTKANTEASTKLTSNASEQMFKMSLEKTFGAKAEAGSIQALQNNAQASNNAGHSENQGLNLSNQGGQNKVQDFKQATASASAKFSEVQKQDVLDQITAKFDQLKTNGNAKITLTLRPNDLGRVVIEMSQDKNGVSATILAQNEDVKKLLEQDIEGLRTKLAQAGVQVDNIVIKTPEGANNNSTLAQDFKENNQKEENSKENNSNQQNKNQNNQNSSENSNEHHQRSYYQESLVENYESYEGIKVGNNGFIRTR